MGTGLEEGTGECSQSDGFGHARPEASRIAVVYRVSLHFDLVDWPRLTKRSVLESKGCHIFHSLDRNRHGATRESLADDELDAAEVVRWAPPSLLQDVVQKYREPQGVEISIFGEVCEIHLSVRVFVIYVQGSSETYQRYCRSGTAMFPWGRGSQIWNRSVSRDIAMVESQGTHATK